MQKRIHDVVWDMETGDPDDFLTLLLLLGHPQVNLKAVTVTPGTREQVGLVRQALAWFERDIPVGAYNINHIRTLAWGRSAVSQDGTIGFMEIFHPLMTPSVGRMYCFHVVMRIRP